MPVNLKGRHFLTLMDFSKEEIDCLETGLKRVLDNLIEFETNLDQSRGD